MAFSPVRLTPSMTRDQMFAVLNEALSGLQDINRTLIMKDETGTNRIILGKQPDDTYGLVISKPGEDVVKLYQNAS